MGRLKLIKETEMREMREEGEQERGRKERRTGRGKKETEIKGKMADGRIENRMDIAGKQ